MSLYFDVLKHIEDHGPVSAIEVLRALRKPGEPRIDGLIRQHKKHGRCHIGGWDTGKMCGLRKYTRALYVAGPGRDAPRPKPLTKADHNQRSYARLKGAASSVFALGVPIKQRKVVTL